MWLALFSKLADMLQPDAFSAGEVIMRQGWQSAHRNGISYVISPWWMGFCAGCY